MGVGKSRQGPSQGRATGEMEAGAGARRSLTVCLPGANPSPGACSDTQLQESLGKKGRDLLAQISGKGQGVG